MGDPSNSHAHPAAWISHAHQAAWTTSKRPPTVSGTGNRSSTVSDPEGVSRGPGVHYASGPHGPSPRVAPPLTERTHNTNPWRVAAPVITEGRREVFHNRHPLTLH